MKKLIGWPVCIATVICMYISEAFEQGFLMGLDLWEKLHSPAANGGEGWFTKSKK